MPSARSARLPLVGAPASLEWRGDRDPGPPGPGCIDLWLIDLGGAGRGQAGYAQDDAHRRMARRWLRRLLGAALGCTPERIAITVGPAGKPLLARRGGPPLFFNASRSGGWALVALARDAELGVDIEEAPLADAVGWAGIARRFFAAADWQALLALPPDEGRDAFLRLWTRHEAVLKAAGLGLAARSRLGDLLGPILGEAPPCRNLPLPAACSAVAALAFRVVPEGDRCG